jgi:hypothetical protein
MLNPNLESDLQKNFKKYQKSQKYKNISVFLLKSDQTKIPKRIKI